MNIVYWRAGNMLVRDYGSTRLVTRLRIDKRWFKVMSRMLDLAVISYKQFSVPQVRKIIRDELDCHEDLSALERRIILDYATHAAEA